MKKILFLITFILVNQGSTFAQPPVVGPQLQQPLQQQPLLGFADLAEKLLPAVVNISTTQVVKNQAGQMPGFPPGSPFDDFFEEFFRNMPQQGQPRERKITSLGSGFIVDPSGYVVTNNHVIDEAEKITVILQDNTELEAKLIGRDTKVDLALLKVESSKPLPAVDLGDSDAVRVGDWVVAIGNPFGLGGTVTAGIVSARARHIGDNAYGDYIQTDAAINRGNSGGPMFNLDGKVIGINTFIVSPSGGNVGIGFAVPANLAKTVIHQLKTYGETRRGWLGVSIQPMTQEIAESLGLEKPEGAMVATVAAGSPAEKAGIQAGDVILSFDGKTITQTNNLPKTVAETEIGKKVDVVLWRKGEKKTVSLAVGKLEEKQTEGKTPSSPPVPSSSNSKAFDKLGISIEPITAYWMDRLQLAPNTQGLVITNVVVNSLADQKGLQTGDVILEVNQSKVNSLETFEKALKVAQETGKKSSLFRIQREGQVIYVALKTE